MTKESTNPWKTYLEHLNHRDESLFVFSGTTQIGKEQLSLHHAVQHLFVSDEAKKREIASITLGTWEGFSSKKIPQMLPLWITLPKTPDREASISASRMVPSFFLSDSQKRERLFIELQKAIPQYLQATQREIKALLDRVVSRVW